MKKKLLSLLLALAMVFTLAACGEKKPASRPWEGCVLPLYYIRITV